MKIAYVLDDGLDSTDGVQQYVLNVGRWMVGRGHEVHYIVGQTKRQDIQNIHSLSKNMRVVFNKNRMTIPLYTKSKDIHDLFSKHHFDILHVQAPYSPLMASKIVRKAPSDTSVIGTFHILPYSRREKYATKALSTVVKGANSRFDQYIVVSDPAKKFAEAYFGVNKIKVIPNPINIVSNPYDHSRKRVTSIKFLGRLVPRKGALELVDAFAAISKQYPEIILDIHGDGPLRAKLVDLIDKNNLNDKVLLHGYLDESHKQSVLSEADIAVFPSLGGESFGIVLIEAVAAGAGVVLGGDNPGYRSVLADNRVLFNPKDKKSLVEILEYFIKDVSRINLLHKQQKEQIKEFDIDKVGARIEDVYSSSIAKRVKT